MNSISMPRLRVISQFHRLQPAGAKIVCSPFIVNTLSIHLIGYQPASDELEASRLLHQQATAM